MYKTLTLPHAPSSAAGRSAATYIDRFESWLRRRGYELAQDPFMPYLEEMVQGPEDSALKLLTEYLDDNPTEEEYSAELRSYALHLGCIEPVWGECGCCTLPS